LILLELVARNPACPHFRSALGHSANRQVREKIARFNGFAYDDLPDQDLIAAEISDDLETALGSPHSLTR